MFVFGHAHRIAKAVNDRESEAVLRRLEDFLNAETPGMVRWLYSILTDQQDAVTYRELREAVEDGYEQEILQWQDDYARMVNEKLKPVLLEAMKAGAAEWERKLGGKLLDDTDRDVQKWIEEHCAAFVTNMADEARGAIKTILWRGQQEEWTPAVIAQHIRPVIGQTRPDAIAIDNYHRNMLKTLREAHPRTADEKLVARAEDMTLKYAALKHRQRADMIANTELAYAYNRGAHESVRAAMKRGLMGPVEKVWLTAGTERVCQHCAGLNGKVVGFDENFDIPGRILFSGMHETPPAHPRCRCVAQYREIGEPAVEVEQRAFDITIQGYSEEDKASLNRIYDKLPEDYRKLYAKYGSELKSPIFNNKKKGIAYYPSENQVYMDMGLSTKGDLFTTPPYNVHFHEYGHNLDVLAGRRYGSNVHFSNRYRDANGRTIKDYIYNDWTNVLDRYYYEYKFRAKWNTYTRDEKNDGTATSGMKKYVGSFIEKWRKRYGYAKTSEEYISLINKFDKCEDFKGDINGILNFYSSNFENFHIFTFGVFLSSQNERRKAISDFCDYMKRKYTYKENTDISDMFQWYAQLATEQFMKFSLPFGSGHKKDYYKDESHVGAEAFAEISAAIATSPESLRLIKLYLPNVFKIYVEMVKEMSK